MCVCMPWRVLIHFNRSCRIPQLNAFHSRYNRWRCHNELGHHTTVSIALPSTNRVCAIMRTARMIRSSANNRCNHRGIAAQCVWLLHRHYNSVVRFVFLSITTIVVVARTYIQRQCAPNFIFRSLISVLIFSWCTSVLVSHFICSTHIFCVVHEWASDSLSLSTTMELSVTQNRDVSCKIEIK